MAFVYLHTLQRTGWRLTSPRARLGSELGLVVLGLVQHFGWEGVVLGKEASKGQRTVVTPWGSLNPLLPYK